MLKCKLYEVTSEKKYLMASTKSRGMMLIRVWFSMLETDWHENTEYLGSAHVSKERCQKQTGSILQSGQNKYGKSK